MHEKRSCTHLLQENGVYVSFIDKYCGLVVQINDVHVRYCVCILVKQRNRSLVLFCSKECRNYLFLFVAVVRELRVDI